MNSRNLAVKENEVDGTMALQGIKAKGRLSGMLFELSVEQPYKNPAKKNIEVVYTFPLAWGATLLSLDVTLGNKRLAGVVVQKNIAEERYEKAIADGDTPIMVERAADGAYTANLGNLMAGEEANICYRYAQTVRVEQGRIRLSVPTTIAPRYGDALDSGMQPHQLPNQSLVVEYPFDIAIDIDAPLSSAQIASTSHQISVEQREQGARISLSKKAHLDRDFVLTLAGLPTLCAAQAAADGDEYVAVASFCPIAEQESNEETPRALKIVIDCSGSMAGDSIEVAKRTVFEILSRLRAHDFFNITRFGSEPRHLFTKLRAAEGEHFVTAKELIVELNANLGGTEMEIALLSVYRLRGPLKSADILLITDGEIEAVDVLIKEAKAHGQRIFAVGVGSAPAESLLRNLAEATGGACELVAPGDRIEDAALRMFKRMQSPQSEQVHIDWPATPVWTASVPSSLYAGDTVHVFAGFKAPPKGKATLRFSTKGASGETCMSAEFPAALVGTDVLARVAAAARLKDGLAEEEACAIALRYQLVTSMTNLLVIHERAAGDKAMDLPALAVQAQMLAAGWGGLGTVGQLSHKILQSRAVSHRNPLRVLASVGTYSDAMPLAYCSVPSQSVNDKDIPAFLRKEITDKPTRHAVSAPKEFAKEVSLEFLQSGSTLPGTIDDLLLSGVPQEICYELKRLVSSGIKEETVVAAFLAALVQTASLAQDFGRHVRRAAKELAARACPDPEFRRRMDQTVKQVSPSHWPEATAWRDAFSG